MALFCLVRPLLLGQNQEEAVEELSLVEAHEIGNIDVFHSAEKINAIGSLRQGSPRDARLK